MTKKKQPAVEAVEPVQISGYRRPPRYRWFEYVEYPGLEDGDIPLKVKVPVNLSFEEQELVVQESANAKSYEDAFKVIAPYVAEWNVMRFIDETGELEAIPSPMVAGWEVLKALDHIEAHWVIDKVKFGYLTILDDANEIAKKVAEIREAAQKKGSAKLEPTDEIPQDDSLASVA